MLETDFVPPAHGRTHWPEESVALHDEPGPLAGSYPAANARDWKRVIEKPEGCLSECITSLSLIGRTQRTDALQ